MQPHELTLTVEDREAAYATLAKGIDEFNQQMFWQCHETLEEIWQVERGPARNCLKGLIQVAAGFFHLTTRRNYRGTFIVLPRGLRYLEPYVPQCLGVDIADLIERSQRCLRAAEALGPERLREFDRRTIPKIVYRPDSNLSRLEADSDAG